MWTMTFSGSFRHQSAISSGSQASCAVIRDGTDQLIAVRDRNNYCQIQPAFISAKIRDIARPLLVRAAGDEVLPQQIF